MNFRQLVARSLRFYFLTHLGVLVGSAVSAAILIGALAVGDSVQLSLRERALERLAGAVAVISSGDRYFEDSLAGRIHSVLPSSSGIRPEVLLELPGTAGRQDATARANAISVVGVPPGFLAGVDDIRGDAVWLNTSLARQLNARIGDEIVVRVNKPTALSRDAVISPRDSVAVALRLRVAGTVSSKQGGDLALQASQTPPLNAFVSRSTLALKAGLEGRGNLVWFRSASGKGSAEPNPGIIERLSEALKSAWQLSDAEIRLRPLAPPNSGWELFSRRIFLDPPVVEAANRATADGIPAPQPILTYLVNALGDGGGKEVPYSMVTAAGPPLTPPDLADDEIVLNSWLAQGLKAQAGDSVQLSYFQADTGPRLSERTQRFRVRTIVPMEPPYTDRSLMPEFPGIAKAESTQDWDAGFPLTRKIRSEDEAYWKQWRGTPKAFVSAAAGQRMWSNRFGGQTALRWTPTKAIALPSSNRLQEVVRSRLDPATVGLAVDAVRERVLAAASQGQDFGGLFIGFSLFLLVSSLLLTAMLFQFALDRRSGEIGILLALGWPKSRVRWLLLQEGAALAVLGSALGLGLGIGYARSVIWGLTTIWSSAVAGASLEFHATAPTLALGFVLSVVVAVLAMAMTLRRLIRRSATALLNEGTLDGDLTIGAGTSWLGRGMALGAVASAVALMGWALAGSTSDPGLFFGAGSLWLASGLLWARICLRALAPRGSQTAVDLAGPSATRLALRNLARRPSRSLGALAMLSSAAFLLAAVGVFKLEDPEGPGRRDSGTGGFSLWGRTALPVLQDLNTERGREFYGLTGSNLVGISVVPFRVREGDDASCLNLSRAQRPRLLGVAPQLLAERGAFSFGELAPGIQGTNGWLFLLPSTISGHESETPAVTDAASLQWILHKQVGDTLDYLDQQGRPFKVRIVGALESSVLQGNLIIAESELIRRFPGESGHREFLVETPPGREVAVGKLLSSAMEDLGWESVPTWLRLAQFNAVQNTYLDTFQVLGGLGLLLGSAGFGIILLRNLHERRGELGLMLALGFQRRSLVRLALTENGALLASGLVLGVGAAAVAVYPSLRPGGPPIPWLSLGITLGLVTVNGIIWTWGAARWSMGGKLLSALRDL